jgi:DNA-binding XRE family transcriptional regulator
VNLYVESPDFVNAKRSPDTPSAADASEAPNELTLALAANLVAARKEIGMSQRELAARSGIARDYLIRIERGDANVGIGILMILARVVGKPASDLIKIPHQPTPEK